MLSGLPVGLSRVAAPVLCWDFPIFNTSSNHQRTHSASYFRYENLKLEYRMRRHCCFFLNRNGRDLVMYEMRTILMTSVSFALSAMVIGNAYYQKKQFYPSVVYITKSNPSMAVGNVA